MGPVMKRASRQFLDMAMYIYVYGRTRRRDRGGGDATAAAGDDDAESLFVKRVPWRN